MLHNIAVAQRVFNRRHRFKAKALNVSLIQMSAKQFEKSEEWTDDNFSDNGEFQDDHVSCFLQDAISTLPLIFFSRHIISYLLFSVFSIFSVLFFYFSILSSFFSISFLLFFPPLFSTTFSLHLALYYLFSLFFSNVLLFLLLLLSLILPSSFLSAVFLLSLFIFLPL